MTDPIDIRSLAGDEAARLTACFERCYGDTYPARVFYDADAIRARIADGSLHPVVAVTAEGEIVGHMALTRRHARALTLEAGNTVVDPRFRNRGLAARLGAALFEACRRGGYAGFHHYPTTAHPIMQKLAIQGGGVETGIMLAYIPADIDYKDLTGQSQHGRLAVVTVYQPIGTAPARQVFPPPRYAELLASLYARAGLSRDFGASAPASPRPATRSSVVHDQQRSLLRIDIEAIGDDLDANIDAAVAGAAVEVIHADVPLADAAAAIAVETLRRRGFFFCALLPEFAACDVLRLQWLRQPDPLPLPELVHVEAREILSAALADRAAPG